MNITEAVKQLWYWVYDARDVSTTEADKLVFLDILKWAGVNPQILNKIATIVNDSDLAFNTADEAQAALGLWDELNEEPPDC